MLLFWLLGFITKDTGSIQGPDLCQVQAKHLDPELVERQKSLKENLKGIREDIRDQQEQQRILKDSSDNLRNTINQLLSIQKQSIEKGSDFSMESGQTLVESQTLFLENQRKYQALSKDVGELTRTQRRVKKQLASVSEQIDSQQALARTEYNRLMTTHRLKVAALKLAVVVPIFLVSAWFFAKKRSGAYGPIVYAAFIAVFVKMSLIVHEYFPRKYFKYIALLVVIGIVLKLLIYLLKRILSPKKDWLRKQYQEAYDRSICPICGKPVRINPLLGCGLA